MLMLGVSEGDEVLCSDLTFAATANAITYCGGVPVFVDSDRETWNMDPALLEEELSVCSRRGKVPKAVVAVDLYGQCADYARITEVCARFGVPLVEDAAEALGATCGGKAAGSFGAMAVLSFNGNKIITTSGGGMLISNEMSFVERARYLSTQAREPVAYYEHMQVGYNYRMSNLLAAVGRGQLDRLDAKVTKRRQIKQFYREALGGIPGLEFMPDAQYGEPNNWLTCLTVDPEVAGISSEQIRQRLETQNIESRPIWKPMHMQPVFAGCRCAGGTVSEALFRTGLCLPSGSGLKPADLERVVAAFMSTPGLVKK
jgi:pyridoxal phosphate-dependent aminotransferase EpsN